MKQKKLFLLYLLFSFNYFYPQSHQRVDNLVENYPTNFINIEELVIKINSDFVNQIDKARAIFYWICKNISYDVEFSEKLETQNIRAFSYRSDKELIDKEKKFNLYLALTAFKSKKAVCNGYAALFSEIANKLGLESKLIRGDLKYDSYQLEVDLQTNHSWNVIKINDEWKFVDCTLAAGKISSKTNQFVFDFNDFYFFTNPDLFFLNHFPDDEKWLLADDKSKLEYLNLPIYFPDFFNYYSSLVLPKKGVFSNNDVFEIVINDFDIENDFIEYKFTNDLNKTPILLDPNSNRYQISLNNRTNQFLNLYVNTRLVAVYKLISM